MQHQIHGKLSCNRERYIKYRNAVQTEDIVKKTQFYCKQKVSSFLPTVLQNITSMCTPTTNLCFTLSKMALSRIHVHFNIPSHSGDQLHLEQFVSVLIILVLNQIIEPQVILD